MHSPYYDTAAVAREVEAGRHREAVGGLWDELGLLQLDFLRGRGLQPGHRMLDIGCGALRLGRHAAGYLMPGNYFGLDISRDLIEAGYACELSDDLRARLPRAHLDANGSFDLTFVGAPVHFAIAQSVFTHLPLNHIRRCLWKVSERLSPGGSFLATAWLVPGEDGYVESFTQSGELGGVPIVTRDIADPYHYRISDFAHACRGLPLEMELIGDWGHPRGQPMLAFQRS